MRAVPCPQSVLRTRRTQCFPDVLCLQRAIIYRGVSGRAHRSYARRASQAAYATASREVLGRRLVNVVEKGLMTANHAMARAASAAAMVDGVAGRGAGEVPFRHLPRVSKRGRRARMAQVKARLRWPRPPMLPRQLRYRLHAARHIGRRARSSGRRLCGSSRRGAAREAGRRVARPEHAAGAAARFARQAASVQRWRRRGRLAFRLSPSAA